MKSRLICLLAALLTVDLAFAQPGQQTSTPNTVPEGGGQYRGPGDLIPPNGPPGAGNCFDVQPTACVLPVIAGVDAGCPDPAIAVEHHLSMYWEEPSPWSSWDDPGTGELDDYLTVNRRCAEDPALGADPAIDGGRFRFHCDCQEGALAAIDSANPGWLNGGDVVYWFFAAP